ncbi:ankyrin repeat domain-containing protein 29 [Aplysia californica]|uniref:Ankyrin repeat domain-containing protein 29 n=1 Tax=Aplysia californica TaxID=6500 RepID=A0ABM0K2T4_APLCA|nr:ankyrin repeat domain-containing protein 29 [Aplysia californica]
MTSLDDDLDKDLRLQLHNSLLEGDLVALEYVLDQGNAAELAINSCKSPLQVAVELDNVDALRILLKAGALSDGRTSCLGVTPMANAAKENKLEILRTLIQAEVSVNTPNVNGATPLHGAAQFGNVEVATELIKAGAKVNVQECNGFTPLMIAVNKSCVPMAEALLDGGALVDLTNRNCQSALMMCVRKNQAEMARLLLKRGANVDLQDYDGQTVLWKVVVGGSMEMLDVLLEFGANVDLCDSEGVTPVMRTALEEEVDSLKRVIQAGADVDAVCEAGETALLKVMEIWRQDKEFPLEIIHTLLEAGANPNIVPDDRLSPLHIAVERNDQLAEMLLSCGALNIKRYYSLRGFAVKLVCPLYLALWYLRDNIADLMLRIGCYNLSCMSYVWNDMDLKARLEEKKQNACLSIVERTWKSPPLLFESARKVVSRKIGYGAKRKEKVDGLPLPEKLKQNLLLG